MLSVTIDGPRSVSFVELPDPAASPGWSVVDVKIAPLCTEFASYSAGTTGSDIGHEALGVVTETSRGSRHRVGDRVFAMPLLGCGRCPLCLAGDYIYCEVGIPGEEPLGTLRERIRKPDGLLVPIPDELADEDAALAGCALGASFGAFERARVAAPDVVLVTGLGAVGLGAVVHGVARGCRVIGVDDNPYRGELARRLGADLIVEPSRDALAAIRDATGGRGADVAIECSGAPAAHRLVIEATRRRGQIGFVGNSYGDTPVRVSPDLIFSGITLFGSWQFNVSSASRLLDFISHHRSLVRKLVTHRFPLMQIEDAWELQVGGQCGKVLILVDSESSAGLNFAPRARPQRASEGRHLPGSQ